MAKAKPDVQANQNDKGRLAKGREGRIQRPSGLTEQVYAQIRADIMSLKIPPDTRIMVDSLARELGVSQTPVREALSMLEAIGLVVKEHYVGYCTAPKFNREEYEKLFELRLLLEPYAARQAALKMEKRQLTDLSHTIGRMAGENSKSMLTSYEHFADRDSEFHELIANGSGNKLIAESLARLHAHLHIFRLGIRSGYANDALEEHHRIEDALKAHDPDAAEKAMRTHIENSLHRLIPYMDN